MNARAGLVRIGLVGLLPILLFGARYLEAQTVPLGGGVASGVSGDPAGRVCFGDVGISRSGVNIMRTDNCAGTAATSHADTFTTTGTGSLSGLTLNNAESIGTTGSNLTFRNATTSGAGLGVGLFRWLTGNSAHTSGNESVVDTVTGFVAGAGSGSYAIFHANPIINVSGAQSGTFYGYGLAVVPAAVNGMTVKLISVGTSTTSNGFGGTIFSGYGEVFGVAQSGAVNVATVTILNASATVSNQQVAFNELNLYLTTNGMMIYCYNCDPPTLVDQTCTAAGAQTGSLAVRTNGAFKCIS